MRFPPISRRAPWKSGIVPTILGAIVAVSLAAALPAQAPAQDQASALIEVLTNGKKSKDTRTIVESTNARLLFSKDIKKGETPPGVIIGNSKVLKAVAGAAQARALLLEAGEVGRTSLTVTFDDGTIEQYLFTVTRDLSMLESALKSIHPSIEATIAPDRDAIVLTGLVPDGTFAARAVGATNDYVSAKAAGDKQGQGKVINLIRAQEAISNLEQRLTAEIERLGATGVSVRRIQQGPITDDGKDVFVISGSAPDVNSLQSATAIVRAAVGDAEGKRVVSQLQSSDRPTSIEEVIQHAIHEQVGATNVKVSRVAQVDLTGDTDVLVLTGTVPSQTALVRALTLASKVFQQQEIVKRKRAGEIERITETFAGGLTRTTETPLEVSDSADDIKVAADESGALRRANVNAQSFEQSNLTSILSGSNSNSGANFGSDVSSLLNNGLDQNIARAKAVELADGRILSFLTVEDLPQVRIEIKLYEVNRNALLQWDSNLRGLAIADYDLAVNNPSPLNSNGDALFPPTSGAPVLGQNGTDVYNVISFLEGTLTNQLQVGGGHFALDSVFRLLEREGLSRTLSSPSLTVLSGEVAAFGDGGSVPETRTVSTGVAGSTGVFSGSEQRDFGVQLAVRPLVDDKGFITLDVVPSVSEPDLILTALLRNTTGSDQNSIAFSKRSLRTSARMRDGDVLLIGGLTQHSRRDETSGTPFLSDVPLIGWLFKDKKYDDSDRELVISVNPSILRDRIDSVHLWEYPSSRELLKRPQKQQNANAAPAEPAPKE